MSSIETQFKPIHGHSCQRQAGSTYNAWQSMLQRCYYKPHKSYAAYGGRGIGVCDRWRSYVNFLADMGDRPPGTSIDRINNHGNYEPSNCRWATPREQAQNRKTSRLLTAFGVTAPLVVFARKYGIASDTLTWRLRHGLPAEQALTIPVSRGAGRLRLRKRGEHASF